MRGDADPLLEVGRVLLHGRSVGQLSRVVGSVVGVVEKVGLHQIGLLPERWRQHVWCGVVHWVKTRSGIIGAVLWAGRRREHLLAAICKRLGFFSFLLADGTRILPEGRESATRVVALPSCGVFAHN